MADRSELIAQFIEISGADENIAQFYLSSSAWCLEDAISNFLGNDLGNVPTHDSSDTESSPRDPEKLDNDNEKFTNQTAIKPKVTTLSDMARQPTSDQDGQAFYAGGSERSGQQVLGPPKRKDFREHLTRMFQMAQAQSRGDDPAPSTSSGSSWGQGIRLGMAPNDHTVINEKKADEKEKRPSVVLKLWNEGFSIDDGELRSYDDPANKEFLETVMRGEVPPELLQMGWMVNVDVEDHRHENFKKNEKKAPTFKGSGHTLGSPVPNVEGETSQPTQTAEPKAGQTEDPEAGKIAEAQSQLNINPSEPTTNLQIRLADGSRLTGQFNLSHTVADVYQYVRHARPSSANANFILVTTFPTQELKSSPTTIAEANLKNAVLMQRIK